MFLNFHSPALLRPLTLMTLLLFTSITLFLAIASDTAFYHPPLTFKSLLNSPVLTPVNSILYNTSTTSLRAHGLHPYYQHFVVNLPLLLLPALPLLFSRTPSQLAGNPRFLSALSATIILSLVPHQEPRFLIPTIPLLLSLVSLPSPSLSPIKFRGFATAWIIFNLALGLLYGRYHQAGVVPAQMWLGENKHILDLKAGTKVFWWKTYSPPVWLLNAPRDDLDTTDLMGTDAQEVEAALKNALGTCARSFSSGRGGAVSGEAILVVPKGRRELNVWRGEAPDPEGVLQDIRDMQWTMLWSERKHIGLDDLDFAEDGVWRTLSKVVRNRGLEMWRIRKECS